jgi:hypothetical protein
MLIKKYNCLAIGGKEKLVFKGNLKMGFVRKINKDLL